MQRYSCIKAEWVMQNSNFKSVQFRCSKRFLNAMGPAGTEEEKEIRHQILCVALWGYLARPQIYQKLDEKALREPVNQKVSILIPTALYNQVSSFASEHKLTLSEVIRMALYQEVLSHD